VFSDKVGEVEEVRRGEEEDEEDEEDIGERKVEGVKRERGKERMVAVLVIKITLINSNELI
jgi:hypothetical protein